MLADLNDPGNVGTLLRSAEAFGAGGVDPRPDGVDPYHPKVVRGAMGAIFRLPLAVASADEFALAAQAAGCRVVGLAARAQICVMWSSAERPRSLSGTNGAGWAPG